MSFYSTYRFQRLRIRFIFRECPFPGATHRVLCKTQRAYAPSAGIYTCAMMIGSHFGVCHERSLQPVLTVPEHTVLAVAGGTQGCIYSDEQERAFSNRPQGFYSACQICLSRSRETFIQMKTQNPTGRGSTYQIPI